MNHPWTRVLGTLAVGALLSACAANPPARAADSAAGDVLPTPRPRATVSVTASVTPVPPAPTPVLTTAGAATILAATTFTPGEPLADPAAWTVQDPDVPMRGHSTWTIADGTLHQDGDDNGVPGMYGTALVTGDAAWDTYAVQVNAYVSRADSVGLVARHTADGYLVFRVTADGAVIECDDASGTATVLAQNEGPGFTANTWTTLRLVVNGTTLTGLVNGTPVISTTDAPARSGRAGVWSVAQGGAQFDDFRVEAYP